ncbi:TRAP-type C4-dicarboxylate transport system, small permease component [Loktanella atrilutea]|uniref:TRAP transporter small permease protein n=1 Tax=Loktanella atrilutea TaxID=366533 RepID=A0A1M5G229_LOKAT|nr:TRAP transporter small permease subunit [Loktanella atrilutea]SHF97694.1 TRAP-type C4-dicarboxylate transport system, small permease component [Loktanella atrilutea]
MQIMSHRLRRVARHAADAVPALLLTAMFLAFIVQVFMRYVLNQPVGWTVEICVMAWIWIILWGQSVSARETDEIRFDIVYAGVRLQTKRVFRILFSACLVAIYAIALPATWDYVSFMRIEKTSYLDIRYNWVFSIFVVFLIASILRYGWIFWTALRGIDTTEEVDPLAVSRKDFSE